MTSLDRVHPAVLLGVKLAVVYLLLPLVTALVRLVIGGERHAALSERYPAVLAYVSMTGAMLAGVHLGWDLLDPAMVGPAIAKSPLFRVPTAVVVATLAAVPSLAALRASWPPPELEQGLRATVVVALVAALVPYTGLIALRSATNLPDDPLAPGTLARAPLRAAVVPSDPDARLGLAMRAASAGARSRAERELGLARGLGVDPAPAFEVEAELAARDGDCRAAERLFRQALRARMPTGRSVLRERLVLGGYHLPPSLVTRCDYGTRHGASE